MVLKNLGCMWRSGTGGPMLGMAKLFRNVGELLAVAAACILLAPSYVGASGENTSDTTWTQPMRYPLQYAYIELDVGITWEEAQSACQAVGGSLATPRNPQEEAFIASAAGFMNRTLYIGVQSVNGMTWTDTNGVPVQFLPWTSRPVMAELCTVIDTASTGPAAWRTVNCNSSNIQVSSVVCQRALPVVCNVTTGPCQYLTFTTGWQNVMRNRSGLRQLSSIVENSTESIYFMLPSDPTTNANTTYIYSLPCSVSISLRQSAIPVNACQPINPLLAYGFNITSPLTCGNYSMLRGIVTEQLSRSSSEITSDFGDGGDEDLHVPVFNIATLGNQNAITVVNAVAQCSVGVEVQTPFTLNYRCSGSSTNYTLLCPDQESPCSVPVQCSNVTFCKTDATTFGAPAVVVFYCPTTGANSTANCSDDGYAGNIFTCRNETPPIVATCDNALPKLVTNTGTVTRINVTYANITCNDQYTCLGQQSIIVSCQEFSANCCAPIMCPSPSLSTLTNGTYTPGNYPRPIGSEVDVNCTPGYRIDYDGSKYVPATSYIAVTCEAKGSWSVPLASLKCAAVDCGSPPDAEFIGYGEQRPTTVGMNSTAFNGAINYRCATGYSLRETVNLTANITISCLLSGRWAGGTPVCARYCGDPGAVNTTSTNVLQQHGYTAGGNVSYMCKAGYQTMNGSDGLTVLTCMANGNWSGIPPICIKAPPTTTPAPTTTVPATTQMPSTNATTGRPTTRTSTTPPQTQTLVPHVSSAQNPATQSMSMGTATAATTLAPTAPKPTTTEATTQSSVPAASTAPVPPVSSTTTSTTPTTEAETSGTDIAPGNGTENGTEYRNTTSTSNATDATAIPPATAGAASSDDSALLIGIGAGVGGALLLVLVVVLIAVTCKRRGKGEGKATPGYGGFAPDLKNLMWTLEGADEAAGGGAEQVVLSNYYVSGDIRERDEAEESTYAQQNRVSLESTFTAAGQSSQANGGDNENTRDQLDRTAMADTPDSEGQAPGQERQGEGIDLGSKPQGSADAKRQSTVTGEGTSTFQTPGSDQHAAVDEAKRTPKAATEDDKTVESVQPDAPVKTAETSILASSGLSEPSPASETENSTGVDVVNTGSGSSSQQSPQKEQGTSNADVVVP